MGLSLEGWLYFPQLQELADFAKAVPDLTIYVGADVPADVSRPFWAIAPPSGFTGIGVDGSIEAPIPTLIRTGDRLLTGLDLSGLRVAEAQRLEAPTAEVLIGAEGAPLLVRGRRSGLPFLYIGFELGRSSLGDPTPLVDVCPFAGPE